MNDIEKKAWQEAFEFAFNQADKHGWDKNRTYKDYAIEHKGKLYPNKIIYIHSLEYLRRNYKDIHSEEMAVYTGVGKDMNDYLASKGANAVEVNNTNMIYWHIQMNQPWGRNKGKIDSKRMLMESKPIIGTGDWNDIQCKYFTGENKYGLKAGDIILVREGSVIISLCEILSDSFVDNHLESKYHQRHFRYVKVLDFYHGMDKFPQPQSTLQRLHNPNTNSWKFIDNYYKKVKQNQMTNKSIDLLKYKKQIILQGPPGTGKTRLAKEIAEEFTGNTTAQFGPKQIDSSIIKKFITKDLLIKTVAGDAEYKIIEVSSTHVKSRKSSGTIDKTSFKNIESAYNENIWQEGSSNSPDRRARAFAKYIYDNYEIVLPKDNSEQLWMVQFHPSYTYEDFVRGIVAESKGEKVEYRNVNKTLGLFAKEALANFKASSNDSPEANLEAWIDEKFGLFKNEIEAKMPEDETILSGDISIFNVTDSHFKYAEKWKTPGYLNFTEFKKLVKAVLQNELELSNKQLDKEKFTHAHYRYTYYNSLLKLFFDNYSYERETVNVEAKNYVLIIDEINRANLSSVLGELIYALEYRGEEVESMYEVEGFQKLVLPPNLYIIGTMNTADRSVGHIDYAIRRRFAFVDVLPEELQDNDDIYFNKTDFLRISSLFNNKNVSNEFEIEAVQIGHSYFIVKKTDAKDVLQRDELFKMKMDYEVKPILLEYERDGILIGEFDGRPIRDYIKSL